MIRCSIHVIGDIFSMRTVEQIFMSEKWNQTDFLCTEITEDFEITHTQNASEIY